MERGLRKMREALVSFASMAAWSLWDRAENGVGRQTYLQPQIDEPIQVQIFHLVLLQ